MALKVSPRIAAVGSTDVLLYVTLHNHGTDEVRDVVVEWDIPEGFVETRAPGPSKRLRTAAAGRKSRAPAPPPLTPVPAPLAGSRALTPATSHVFHRIAAEAEAQATMPLRPVRAGRFSVKVRALTWVDAAGQRHSLRPDAAASFTVEEPVPPQIEVTARSPMDVSLGEPIAVEVRIDNRGNLPARALTIHFDLPEGVHVADTGESHVAIGPLDIDGRRHRSLSLSLLPEGPGELRLANARASFTDLQGQEVEVELPPIALRVAVRLDPGRVFVGRDRHREKLSKLLESVALPSSEASSRVVLVAGRAGIGKSRLVEEIKTRARLGGYLVADTRATGPAALDSPGVLRSLLSSMLDLGPLLAGSEAIEASDVDLHLKRLGRTLPPPLAHGLYALVSHLRLSRQETTSGRASSGLADPAGFFTDLVRHVTRFQPLLIAVDDVHWTSAADRRTLSRLLVGTRDCRVLAIMTYREENLRDVGEFLDQMRAECGATHIRLAALNYEACRALVTENFAGANFPDWLVRAIHTRSKGVPLYEVEALRCLVLDGTVRYHPSEGWKADEKRAEAALAELPGSAQGLVATQVTALRKSDPTAFRVMQDAAVLDADATPEILAEMGDLEQAAVEEAIRLLVVRGILREMPVARVPVAFAHPLKKEVALPGPLDLAERHRAAARAVAQVSPDGMAGAVALHFMAAGQKAESFRWYVRWARLAQESGALQDALAAFEEAARLYVDEEVAPARAEIARVEILRPLLALLMERGSARRSLEVAETLQELARRPAEGAETPDRALESEAAVARARSLSRLGRDLEALQAFYAAVDLSEESGRPELAVTASLELSEHYRDRDREEPARRVARNAAERFLALPAERRAEVDPVNLVAALCRADCIAEARQVWEAVFGGLSAGPESRIGVLKSQRAQSYLVAYTEGEDAVAHFLEKCIAQWRGEGASGLLDGSQALEGVPDEEAAAWLETLCRALWLSGNIPRALEMLDASWARRGHQVSLRHRARYLADRANLLAALERGREAAAHAAEYVQVARGLDEPHLLCDALLNAAYLALAAGDTSATETSLDEGMRMARDRSMPSLLCRAQLLMAGLEMARGRPEPAFSWCRQGRRMAEDHGLSPELVAWAATECARCRAAMGELAEAAAECGTEAERLQKHWNASYALSCLRAQAGYLLELGDLDGARGALEKAAALPSGRPGGGREREQALRELAEVLIRQGDIESAVTHIQESLAIRSRGLSSGEPLSPASSSLEHLAVLCERLQMIGQPQAARELLQRAVQSLSEEDVPEQALAQMALARLDALEGEVTTARAILEKALKALGPAPRGRRAVAKGALAPEERRRRRARILVRTEIGRVEALIGNLERAQSTLESARREARMLGDEEVTHNLLAVLGRVLEELDRGDEARAAWEEIARGTNPSLSSALRMEAFMGLARAAVGQDRLEEAAGHVQAAEEAALEAGWVGTALLGQVAEAWEVLGRAERSLGLIERAVTIVRLAGVEERGRLPGLLQVMARLLCQVDPPRFRDAVRAAEEAIEISRQVGEPASVAENMEGMAHILILAGEEPRAVEHFHSALHLYERLGHEAGAGRVHGHLARLHLQMGNADAARSQLEEALRLGGRVRGTSPEVLAEALLTAASMEHEQGHVADASAYLLTYLDLALANADVAACVLALHGLDDQPTGYSLERVSGEQWTNLDRILEGASPSDDVVECRLAGAKGLESLGQDEERERWLDEALHAARQCPTSRLDPATMDDLARALERRGDFGEAANIYRALAARGEDPDGVGDVEEMRAYACGRAGELLTHAGLVQEGLQMYYEAERHAEKAASPIKDPGLAWNAFAIASIHLDEGEEAEARRWYRTAVQRWQTLLESGSGETEERFNFMAMLALAQAMAGAPGDALATLERFRARVEQDHREFLNTWVGAACDLAEALVRQNDFDAAQYALNEALSYLDRADQPEFACRVYTMQSWVAAERKDLDQAFEWSDRALARLDDVSDATVALQAWVQAATLRAWTRDGAGAAPCHQQVIELATQHGDWKLVLEHRESLVLALAGAGQLAAAQAAWNELVHLRLELTRSQPELRVPRPRFAMAAIRLRAGDTENARALLMQDLEEVDGDDEADRAEEIAFLLSWLGTACNQAGELEDGIEAMLQCIALVRHLTEPGVDPRPSERTFTDESLASVYLELCEMYARLGQWEEAAAALDEAQARAASDPWVRKRLPEFREALAERRDPPHADPLVM